MQSQRVAAGAASAASIVAAALFIRRYLLREIGPPILVHALNDRKDKLDKLLLEVRALLRDYRPHPLLEFSGLLSTIACGPSMVLPDIDDALGGRLTSWGLLSAPGHLETLRLADGGTVSLHWGLEPDVPVDSEGGPRAVLLLPGLNNSSRTPYIQATMKHLRRKGFRVAALNYRGVGGTMLTSDRVGCADSYRDLPEVFAHMEATLPGVELYAIGYSMGGGILLRHLGEVGARTRLRAAATVAAPLDNSAVVAFLESSFTNRLFNRALASGAAHNVIRNLDSYPHLAAMIDQNRLRRAHSIRDIDEAVVCPINGYTDSEDYYANSSPLPTLHQVKTRALILHAEDDPVVGMSTLPLESVRSNPYLLMAITKRGGHISWTGSGRADGAAWVDRVATRFFEAQRPTSRL